MGFNSIEQKKYDDYRARLAGCEAEAIASALATMMVFSHLPEKVRDTLFAEIKENTRIIRHNRRVTATRKKINRVQELYDKKKLKPAERQEFAKLAKSLGYKEQL